MKNKTKEEVLSTKDVHEKIIEKLADLEHQQWAHWTKYLTRNFTEENVIRWEKQRETPYKDLSEKEKESDREWARKVFEICQEQKAEQVEELKNKERYRDYGIIEEFVMDLKEDKIFKVKK